MIPSPRTALPPRTNRPAWLFRCFFRLLSAACCLALAALAPAAGPNRAARSAAAPATNASKTPTTSPAGQIDRLIRQLGDPNFEIRRSAQAELARLGIEAFEALDAARYHADPEIAARARYLLRLIQVDFAQPGDPPEVAALLRQYGTSPFRMQLACLDRLAALPHGKGLSALCRLAKFEPSILLTKHAAVRIVEHAGQVKPPDAELVKTIRSILGESHRPAGRWLLVYAQFHDSPRDALPRWKELADAEQVATALETGQTDPRIIRSLVRWQAGWTAKLSDDPKEVVDAIRSVLRANGAKDSNLPAFAEWLVAHKAWDELRTDPITLAERLAGDPVDVLLTLADVYRDAGKKDLVGEILRQVTDLAAWQGTRPYNARVESQFYVAMMLRERGFHAEAAKLCRDALNPMPAHSMQAYRLTSTLVETLVEQSEHLQAAQAMEAFVKRPDLVGQSSMGVSARVTMHVQYAAHWGSLGDRAKQRQALEAALNVALGVDEASLPPGPNRDRLLKSLREKAEAKVHLDCDLLIACHRLPDAPPEFRQRTRRLIQTSVKRLRERIARSGDGVQSRNELAWLVSNTEGDFDEALRMSKESNDSTPENGSLLDTLAHCYFAKGDYAAAVKTQIRAAELDPHSLPIQKSLERFRTAYEKQTGRPAPKPSPRKRPSLQPLPTLNGGGMGNVFPPEEDEEPHIMLNFGS